MCLSGDGRINHCTKWGEEIGEDRAKARVQTLFFPGAGSSLFVEQNPVRRSCPLLVEVLYFVAKEA